MNPGRMSAMNDFSFFKALNLPHYQRKNSGNEKLNCISMVLNFFNSGILDYKHAVPIIIISSECKWCLISFTVSPLLPDQKPHDIVGVFRGCYGCCGNGVSHLSQHDRILFYTSHVRQHPPVDRRQGWH